MKRESHILASCFLSAIVSLAGCGKTDVDSPVPVEADGVAEYVLDLTGIMEEEEETGTKSILGTDSSTNPFIKDSGYQVFAFNRRIGVLEAVATVDSYKTQATLSLSTKDSYDFFVVGNLWFFSGSTKTGWDAMFKKLNKYPAKAADMSDATFMPYYRFDGQTVGNTGLRSETFAQVATYGIPYSGKVEGVTYANSRNGVSVSVKRLFCKVTLTIDHSGLINSGSADAFVNKSIHLRQVNCRVHPFIENISAAAEDILASAEDYEANPLNGASQTFVFYVPENCGGTYSVSSPLQKIPSKAGAKSGCVTYLEFVGKLDAAKAGGYGGTLRYQFCLGGNSTTNYNVVRNNNYKVNLGFKASSIFEDVDWKMDVDGSLTDTRVLGLSADASGSHRLDESGNQIVAVRPSNTSSSKRELYVFFNHNNGTINEWSSYIDPYTMGWTPSSAKRSAVKVGCPAMDADGIQYSLDPSTGKLSFWTTKPAAMVAGHTYTVTLTLMPNGQSKSFKVKVYPNINVSANVADFFVGMKRNISAGGFAGSNISLKVVSGGENIFRCSNSAASDGGPGTDKYVTRAGMALSGMSVPLYAYRPGSVTLAVSSDDNFNDGTFTFSVNVQKPYVCYDDIKGNEPIWDKESNSVIYGSTILLPFDGTLVDVPAYYCVYPGIRSTKITVGTGENQFDSAVYAQLLDFVFAFTSDCVAKDPESLKIYLHHWQVAPNSYFETSLRYSDFVNNPSLLQKVFQSRVMINPRSTELFDDGFQVYVTTILPGFYDITQREEGAYRGYKRTTWEKTELTSNYFNGWDSSWSAWKTNGEIDTDVLKARWPKITNSIGFNLMGCSKSLISYSCSGDHDATLPFVNDYLNKGFDGQGDFVTFNWKFAPGECDNGITDTKGAAAPYGKQRLKVKVTNRHSHEVLELDSPDFNLKYENVRLSSYMFGTDWENEADYYVGAASVLAWLLYEKSRNAYFDPYDYSTTMPMPLNAVTDTYISCSKPSYLTQGMPGNIMYRDAKGTARFNLHAMFSAWKRDGGYPAYIDNYSDAYWNKDLMQWWYNSLYAMPRDFAFEYMGRRYSETPRSVYSNDNLYNYVRIFYDTRNVDGELTCKGFNIY